MKKFLLPAVFFAFIFSASSQTEFGIKTGLNISNIRINFNGASPGGKVDGFIGSFVDFPLSEKFHIQPEVMYSQEGIEDGSVNFLNVPVTLKWFFVPGIHFNAGPQMGFVIDADGGTNGLNRTNFSGVFGFGYESPGGFMIDTRFAQGISSIIDEDFQVDSGMGYNIIGIKGWTQTFQIGIGYKF